MPKARELTAGRYAVIRRNGRDVHVRKLSNGSEIERDPGGNEYRVTDANGNYLGFTADEKEAEYMARHQYVNIPASLTSAGLLTLRLAWNDARDSGADFMQAKDGTQVVELAEGMFLLAVMDSAGEDVQVVDKEELYERYGSKTWDSVVDLCRIEQNEVIRL